MGLFNRNKKEVQETVPPLPKGIEEVVVSGKMFYRVIGFKSIHETSEKAMKQLGGINNANN